MLTFFRFFNKSILFFLVIVFVSCSSKNESIEDTTNYCSSIINRNDSVSISEEFKSISDSLLTKTGVFVLEDGSSAMVSRAWFSEYAENTIDIQYFIFSMDNIGLIACDYLVRAADRGIKVRILVDDIMVDADAEDILTLSSHENISIKIYNPGINLGKNIFSKLKKVSTDFRSANQRMHNKTFIVDDKIVITGGRNVADEYYDYDHEYNFRDRDILMLGKETKKVKKSFDEFWNDSLSYEVENVLGKKIEYSKNNFNKLHEYACNPNNFWPQIRKRILDFPRVFKSLQDLNEFQWLDDVSFVSDVPGKNDGKHGLAGGGESTSVLIDLIKNAKYTIEIQTPYLITTKLGQNLFKEAVDRGVKIRVLTNSLASTDNVEAFSSYQSNRRDLLKTGIRIFEFRPDAAEQTKIMTGELQASLDNKPTFGLHAKSMVIDDITAVVGTFNLDPRSANLNTECFVVVNSKEISKGILDGMEEEFKPENSWETTFDFNPDSKVSNYKRFKTWTRKILPKEIL